MRCRNFFSAAVRQGSGAWPPFLDNNSWICLFLHPCCLVPSPPPPPPLLLFCLSSPTLSVFFVCLFLCSCLTQRFVQRTVVAMAFVCRAPAAVTTAGWAPGVTRGRVTLAATNTAFAGTANANAVQDGTENTALSVGGEEVWGIGGGVWEESGACAGGNKGAVCLSVWVRSTGCEGKGPVGEGRGKHA